MVGEFNRIKFSLFHYPYPLIKPLSDYQGIFLAGPEDIASMKLVAITDRGTKKDYIDLFYLVDKKFSLEKMFEFYQKKYKIFEANKLTLLKSLQYFEDADASEMPQMIEKVEWQEVKDFFQKQVLKLIKKYL